jgi:cytoskeleton protein RodZ
MSDASIGEVLSRARQDAGLTTQEVSESTRIRRALVEAIERDDFSMCGGDVYARGHITTLARTVGADPAPLLADFAASHREPASAAAAVFELEHSSRAEHRGPNWSAAMGVALAVVVAVVGFQVVTNRSDPAVEARPSPSAPADDPNPTPEPSAPATPSPAPSDAIAVVPAPSGVSVVLTVVGGKSWVSATQGAEEAFSGLLDDGTERTFSDPERVKLTIGNAGAVRLVVNGVDLGAAGGPGEVVRLTFGPGDPTGAAG